MNAFLSQILPVLYGACFLVLLWQAFKVMAQGFKAVPRPGDPSSAGSNQTPAGRPSPSPGDRTGRVTIHPELLDAEGQSPRKICSPFALAVITSNQRAPVTAPTKPRQGRSIGSLTSTCFQRED